MFELPKRGLSGFLRRATPAEAEAALRASLDEGLLRALGPFAAVHPYRLEAQVTDMHTLVVSPKPAPGGAESSSRVGNCSHTSHHTFTRSAAAAQAQSCFMIVSDLKSGKCTIYQSDSGI